MGQLRNEVGVEVEIASEVLAKHKITSTQWRASRLGPEGSFYSVPNSASPSVDNWQSCNKGHTTGACNPQ